MNKILILGKGYIGQRLQEELKCNISSARINSFKDAEKEIEKYNPKVIINCIGYKGKSNVDDCELDKDSTLFANTFIPILLAEVCLRNNIKLVHISTGCFYNFDYNKDKPITEKRVPDYNNLFYSRTKNYSERALEILLKDFNILILRIRIPLDNRSHQGGLLNKLIKYKTIIDLSNSVTYIPDFIKAIKHLIKIDAKGIFNVMNKGGLRYFKLLDVYKKYVPDFEYKIIDLKKLNIERTNLIMSVKKLEDTGFKVRHVNDVLEECVKGYLSTVND